MRHLSVISGESRRKSHVAFFLLIFLLTWLAERMTQQTTHQNDVVLTLFSHISMQNDVLLRAACRKIATSAFWQDFLAGGT